MIRRLFETLSNVIFEISIGGTGAVFSEFSSAILCDVGQQHSSSGASREQRASLRRCERGKERKQVKLLRLASSKARAVVARFFAHAHFGKP